MDWGSIEKQSDELYQDLHDTHEQFYHLWVNNILFTWKWWLGVSMIIVPWAVWLIVRKKESQDRLLYAGFFVMVVSSALDAVGIAMNLWCYPINVFPLMPEFIPFDISCLPVATMLFIQFFPKIHPTIKAAIYALLASFVFQPLMNWIGLYNNLHWPDYYSIPILIVLYLLANLFANKKKFNELK